MSVGTLAHIEPAPGGARGEERRREGSNSTSKKAVVSNGTIARLLKATAFVVWDTTELSLLALGLFDPERKGVGVGAANFCRYYFCVCCGSIFVIGRAT